MEKYYLEKLEYNKILEKLQTFCKTYLGKEEVKKLQPYTKEEKVKEKLKETDEAINMIYKTGNIAISEIADNTDGINILKAEGVLSAKKILEIVQVLKVSETLKKN